MRVSESSVARQHLLVSMFPGYSGYAGNNRPTQPLNGRTILRNTAPWASDFAGNPSMN